MTSKHFALIASLACLAAGSAASLFAGDAAILFPGQFHGDEVSATSGETWLALLRGGSGVDQLNSVVLQVDTVVDDIVDEKGAATGRRVSTVGDHPSVLFFVRDAPGVRQGHVETVAGRTVLKPNKPVTLALSGGPANLLELRCQAPQLAQEWEEVRCDLVFSRGEDAQILKTYSASYHNGRFDGVGNSAFATIVWAGDLNGDALLDLVFDLTDHYNLKLPTLFLSPGPGDTRLLVLVANHRSIGC